MSNDSLYLHCLGKTPGIGAEKLRRLRAHFGTFEASWHSDHQELLTIGFSSRLADSFQQTRKKIHIQQEQEILDRHNIHLVSLDHPDYPELLTEIPNPPELLYFRGNAHPNQFPLITIVGTRKPTKYGSSIAKEFARELAKSGFSIVSGMAFGIDREAHIGTLETKNPTLAILGNGLDDTCISPQAHLGLAQSIIASGGALISDYPPGTSASTGTFPARNRIMAGMTLGTLVIESTQKSGTFITANLALEYNREVFAVPGSIYSEYSRGPHELIRRGAMLAGSVADILGALPIVKYRASSIETISTKNSNLSQDETILLKELGSETLHIDKLVKLSTLGTSTVLSTISFLEMKGLVKNVGNMHYIRTYTIQ